MGVQQPVKILIQLFAIDKMYLCGFRDKADFVIDAKDLFVGIAVDTDAVNGQVVFLCDEKGL